MRDMRIAALRAAYADGSLTPTRLVEDLLHAGGVHADRNIWILPP